MVQTIGVTTQAHWRNQVFDWVKTVSLRTKTWFLAELSIGSFLGLDRKPMRGPVDNAAQVVDFTIASLHQHLRGMSAAVAATTIDHHRFVLGDLIQLLADFLKRNIFRTRDVAGRNSSGVRTSTNRWGALPSIKRDL
jgi:hypothetical protein